jgi:hypothetical protein
MIFTKSLLITKLKATAVHLCLSIGVFVYLAYQIYYNWYPQPYFAVDGGWQGIRLIGAVDLVLGPIITFLIFDLSKSRRAIVFDLIVIMIIQFGALSYGIHVTYTQRPVAIIIFDDFTVPATMGHYGGTLKDASELQRYSDEKPPIIVATFPMTREALAEINRRKIKEKVLEHAQMNLYGTQADLKVALQTRQVMMSGLLDTIDKRPAFEDWLQQNGKTEDQVLIQRFSGRYGYAWLVFDAEGKYIGYF